VSDTTDAIGAGAKLILGLIELIAKQLGEPVADVRKRVLKVVADTAKDPSDETDPVADAIDADLP
jgi:hypothetical protein